MKRFAQGTRPVPRSRKEPCTRSRLLRASCHHSHERKGSPRAKDDPLAQNTASPQGFCCPAIPGPGRQQRSISLGKQRGRILLCWDGASRKTGALASSHTRLHSKKSHRAVLRSRGRPAHPVPCQARHEQGGGGELHGWATRIPAAPAPGDGQPRTAAQPPSPRRATTLLTQTTDDTQKRGPRHPPTREMNPEPSRDAAEGAGGGPPGAAGCSVLRDAAPEEGAGVSHSR